MAGILLAILNWNAVSTNLSWMHYRLLLKDWNVANEYLKREYRLKKCAEVLVPHNIPPDYIIGAFVLNVHAASILERQGFDKLIKIKPEMFFR